MAIERPTFSESWYRVADQHPRLRSTVQTYRQQHRGQLWHVVRDPSNNQFFRLNEPAYHFVGLLDGRRTVAQVWQTCNEQLGDQAPTQNEAIQLLGQLYAANLLHGEMPADAEGMFERYRKRVNREVRGYMMNLLFIRIPLIDPDRFLNAWSKVFGWIFSWFGFAIWLGLVGTGIYFVIGHVGELWHSVNHVLDQNNLIFLYITFAAIKVIHEFGHGFACKKYGLVNGSGGEVHTMGIMFLVFAPVPYVDASSAWSLRSKWQRIMISAGGMYVELMVAAVAAIVWAHTRETTIIHTIAYNTIFIASISTLLFNANPLLRFDGYYILSDLLEVPNLSQRSKDYLYYLVKKFVYGAKRVRTNVTNFSEKRWLTLYAVASSIYRVFISVRILMFIADKLFFLGAALAVVAIVTWVFVPLGKWAKYLATSPELMRCRPRAVLSTVVFFGLLVGLLGGVPMAERDRAEGFVEPVDLANVHAGAAGFVREFHPSGEQVSPDGPPLLVIHNEGLLSQRKQKMAERRIVERQLSIARTQSAVEMKAIRFRMVALDKDIAELRREIERLRIRSPIVGVWVAPQVDQLVGAFVKPGDSLGRVVGTKKLIVRALADQTVGPRIVEAADKTRVEMRVKGRPEIHMYGTIVKVLPAGAHRLPTASMGYGAEGALAVDPTDQEGTKTTEKFFEIHVAPDHVAQLTVANRGSAAVRGTARLHVTPEGADPDNADQRLGSTTVEIDLPANGSATFDVAVAIATQEDGAPLPALSGAVEWTNVKTAPGQAGSPSAPQQEPKLAVEIGKVAIPGQLLPGQRIVMRFEFGDRPLAFQWWQSIRQLVQRRFQT